jgi:hypothetical protein
MLNPLLLLLWASLLVLQVWLVQSLLSAGWNPPQR